jgi:hypothetical protein
VVGELLNEAPCFFLNVGHTAQYGDAFETGQETAGPPNGSRLSCGALKKDSFHNLRAPTASSAC